MRSLFPFLLGAVFVICCPYAWADSNSAMAEKLLKLEEKIFHESLNNSYRLDTNDILKITVYGEAELSSDYAIDESGAISMPLIGEVIVKNLNLRETETTIAAKLSEGFLVNPSVTVEIAEYRPFYIMGEVQNPGSYSYVNNMTIMNAVAMAGGFTYRANRTRVKILRGEDKETSNYKKMEVSSAVLPGDIILVQERLF